MFKDEADFEKVVGRLNIDTEPNPEHKQKLHRQMLSAFNQAEQEPATRIIVFRALRRITMNTIIEQFRKELLELKLYEHDTVANYIACIYKYVEFVKSQFAINPIKTTPQHLKQWMVHLKNKGISNSRLTHHRSALVNFFTFLQNIEIIENNPTDGLFPIRKTKSDLNQPIDINAHHVLLAT